MKRTIQPFISYVRLAGVVLCSTLLLFGCSKKGDSPDKEPQYQTDVYIAGAEHNGSKAVAKYWKNGTPVTLTDGTNHAIAFSIFVSDNDVYITGYEHNSADKLVAKYWKNGTPVILTDGTKNGAAYSIFVSDSDVYVAGAENNSADKPVATYWKNGVPTRLTNGTNESSAHSVFVTKTLVE